MPRRARPSRGRSSGSSPIRCVIQPESGASANIPATWPLITTPDRAEPVAVGGQVERRHRHDQDHRGLAGDERRDRGEDGRAQRGSRGPAGPGAPGVRVDGRLVGERERIRPQEHEGQQRGRRSRTAIGIRYGPAQLGQAEDRRDLLADRHERRTDDAADGRAPDDEPDRDRAPVGRDEVGGGVARQVVRRVAEADDERAEDQQREAADDDGQRSRSSAPTSPTT